MSSVDEILNEWSTGIDNELRAKKLEATRNENLSENRQLMALRSTYISLETARYDLLKNQDSPFMFRKWLRDYAFNGFDKKDWLPLVDPYLIDPSIEGITDDVYHQRVYKWKQYNNELALACGRLVCNMLGVSRGPIHIDHSREWTYPEIRSLVGPCSHWQGHTGYTWEGSYEDNRKRW
jgi:hypothetical protein